MKNLSIIVLGSCMVLAALGHAVLVRSAPRVHTSLLSGYVQGEVWKRENGGIAKLRCNGFRAELHETFVAIHVDKDKEPTWTDNYVVTIPWSKVERLTLLPAGRQR